MNIINCPSCGKKTLDDQSNCEHCGAPLAGMAVAEQVRQPPPPEVDEPRAAKKKFLGLGLVPLLAIAGGLVVAIVVVIILAASSGAGHVRGVLALGDVTNSGHACVVLEDGSARCWGANEYGELGDGTTTRREYPVAVKNVGGVSAISCGRHHTCALLRDGSVRCWGLNHSPAPAVLPGGRASGTIEDVPLLTPSGQLGNGMVDGDIADSEVPVTVGLSGVVDIAAGGYHTCAVLQDGSVRCWGANDAMVGERRYLVPAGQLGNDANKVQTSSEPVPVRVVGISNARSIDAGMGHTCALLEDATVRCWGLNDRGMVGDGTTENRFTPVMVQGLERVRDLSLGSVHSCAVTEGREVYCWGSNSGNQVTGQGNFYRTPTKVNVTDVVGVSAGKRHTCALHADGSVTCWGGNEHGELGNGQTGAYDGPQKVQGVSHAVAIAAGADRTCALLRDGTVRCWGRNDTGGLGDGRTATHQTTPVGVCTSGSWNGTECSGGPLLSGVLTSR